MDAPQVHVAAVGRGDAAGRGQGGASGARDRAVEHFLLLPFRGRLVGFGFG